MDQFQIKFWKSRQAEWEPYTYQYAPLKIEQGRLTDPLYFDFISYIQFQSVAGGGGGEGGGGTWLEVSSYGC
jgi:hypothetical protein